MWEGSERSRSRGASGTGGTRSGASAQSITAYEARVYQGGQFPVPTYPFDAATVVCGQPRPPVDPKVVNPVIIRWQEHDRVVSAENPCVTSVLRAVVLGARGTLRSTDLIVRGVT